MQLSEIGIDKSSFKNISSIMNRTLIELENKFASSKNQANRVTAFPNFS